jgi:hypothetical protein
MEGSEEQDRAVDTVIAGVMAINEDGSAVYETADEAENPQTITLTLTPAEDGLTADVIHSGEFNISPDGHYTFTEAYIEVSDVAAVSILEHLPTAATSLNHNNGEYTINFPDALISDWFYPAEAVFNDSGATLAKFLIAKDLSAVFRADDDIEPVLIYGSAQPMMDAYVMDTQFEENDAKEPQEGEAVSAPNCEPRMLVSVMLPNSAVMQIGATDTLEAVIPGDLPYAITAESQDNTIVTVDESGVVTAIAEGETVIDCVVTCEDGAANIGLAVTVVSELEVEEYIE